MSSKIDDLNDESLSESINKLKLDKDQILDDSSIKIEIQSSSVTTTSEQIPIETTNSSNNVHCSTITITYSLPNDITPPPPMPPISSFSSDHSITPPPPPPLPSMMNSSSPIPPPPPLPSMMNSSSIPPPPPLPSMMNSSSPIPPPPPPPMMNNSMGSPIPPPPPPMMSNLNGPNNSMQMINPLAKKRIVYNPKSMMKTLYWSKVNVMQQLQQTPIKSKETQKSIWVYTDDLELKFEEFEKLFAQPKIQPKKVKSIEKEEKSKPNETADLLDRNRAHNLNILIKSLRIDTVELANAIYNFDSHTFNQEKLKKISEIVATGEERDSIIDHLKNNPTIPLGNAERFLYDLDQIHCFGDRINCFLFTLQFDEQIQSIEHSLNNFKLVCRFLLKSSSLRNLISIILTLGNYMNSNTTRGQSDAFDISILPKLKDTKSSVDNSCNLLYYVVKIYVDQNFNQDDILKKKDLTTKLPVPEPQDLERASSVSFNEIKRELDSIKAQIKTIEERYKRVIDSCAITEESTDDLHIEPFQSKMKSMIEYARRVHQEHDESLEECQAMFIDTMDFFLFKPKSTNLAEQQREFFGIWLNFCTAFKDQFRKVINAKIKEAVDHAKQGAKKIMNKNLKINSKESNNCEKKSTTLAPNGLKARLIGKFKR